MSETCCVCQENMQPDDATTLTWPGCGHRIHVACALSAAQYDVRCPLCRHQHEGLVPRKIGLMDVVQTTTGFTPQQPPVAMDGRTGDAGAWMTVTAHVVVTPDASAATDSSAGGATNDYRRARRNYAARRRRCLRSCRRIFDLNEITQIYDQAQLDSGDHLRTLWEARNLHLWNEDAEILQARRHYRLACNRAARRRRLLRVALHERLGSPPRSPPISPSASQAPLMNTREVRVFTRFSTASEFAQQDDD